MRRSLELFTSLILVLGLGGSGCILVRASRNVSTLGTAATLTGKVEGAIPEGRAAFVVALERKPEGWARYSSRIFYRAGSFEFLVRPGTYRAFAFVDLNGNRKFEAEEPSALGPEVQAKPGDPAALPPLALSLLGDQPPVAISLAAAGEVAEELVKVHRGDVAQLTEDRMSTEAGQLGYWQPVDFAMKYGVGVSFLQPYAPDKIPVVFVHGAGGYPGNFANIIAALDRRRFQPWVYSYPSGIRLALASTTLKRILDDLQHQHGFKALFVVAHSMGGLVARDFAVQAGKADGPRYTRALVTLSTPFDGHEMARLGVDRSPVVIPSWLDMVAGSPFLVALQTARLPPCTPHFLLTSFEGGRSDGRNTDGTVSLQSQLHPSVQRAAARVVAIAANHDTILDAAETFGVLNELLAEAADKVAAEQK